ncbi:hypothetical protein HanPI659440_Chr01g0030371 [Helianthus annuus]|nr:hypothetical protein HanPI659440_Chr01g0030371 [Helianthus annuus]
MELAISTPVRLVSHHHQMPQKLMRRAGIELGSLRTPRLSITTPPRLYTYFNH